MRTTAWRELLAGFREGMVLPVRDPNKGVSPPDTAPEPALAPPDWIEIPAFLRRCGPLLTPGRNYDDMLERHELLSRAAGIRQAAEKAFQITRSAWLADQLKQFADEVEAGMHRDPEAAHALD